MKKNIVLIIVYITLCLSSCQPTPEEEIVRGKNNDKFIEAIEQAPNTSVSETNIKNIDEVDYPEKWETHYEKYNGKFKMTIEAEVIADGSVKYPVAEIQPYYVPIKQANKIIETIFGDSDVYFIMYSGTKEQIENDIIQVKADIQQAKKDNNDEEVKYLESVLEDFLNRLENAPEDGEATKYKEEYLIYKEEGYESHYLDLRKNPYDIETPALCIHNVFGVKYGNGYDSFANYKDPLKPVYAYSDDNIKRVEFNEHPIFNTEHAKEAIETANAFLEKIGVSDRVLVGMTARKESENSYDVMGYKLRYSKKFNNIPIPLFVQWGGSSSNDSRNNEEEYIAPYIAESLWITIENGEVSEFSWERMSETKEIIKDDVEILGFDEIMKIAEKQLSVKYAYIENQEANYEYYVDKIYLTYAVEPLPNEKYKYMLIPVWAFYGGIDYGDGYEQTDGTVRKGKYTELGSLLTINAVDGSIIIGN